MGVWLIILAVVLAGFVLGFLYMLWAVGQFPLVKKLSKDNKKRGKLISLAVLMVFLIIVTLAFSLTNAVIILLIAVFFRLIFGIVGRIVKKATKKTFKFYWEGWAAVLATVIYFVCGYVICHHVVKTEYNLTTDKEIGSLKIAMIADSHLGTTFDAEGFEEHLNTIMKENPDVLFIAGDFVDDGTTRQDMIKACEALGKIKPKYGIIYCYGNHDRGYNRDADKSFTAEELDAELMKNNVQILQDAWALIDDRFYAVGREDASEKVRSDASLLTSKLDKDKYIIMLDHQPNDYDAEASSGADLVLSGHTHGGQLFPVNYVGEWFNINDRTYGYEKRKNTEFIVTSGISDWEIKFKTGTKSEYVIINVEGK